MSAIVVAIPSMQETELGSRCSFLKWVSKNSDLNLPGCLLSQGTKLGVGLIHEWLCIVSSIGDGAKV